MDLKDKIVWLKQHGSSLTMNWGEDTDTWDVEWISGGERRSVSAPTLEYALDDLIVNTFYAVDPTAIMGMP